MSKKLSPQERQKAFLNALAESRGIISTACKRVGISRQTYYNWLADDEAFRDACNEIAEEQIDQVESRLLDLIEEGDVSSTLFYLKTKGRNRGYNERLELTGKDGKDLTSISDSDLDERIARLTQSLGGGR